MTLSTPRRVPIPFLPKVKKEFQFMGLIHKTSKSPQNGAQACMVVVPKPNEKVKMCIDLTKLNESSYMQGKTHYFSVEQMLAQIG